MSAPPTRALFVGRFQPFHLGHLKAIETIRERRPDESLLIGIGSAQESYTPENPFTAGERFDMIDRALREARVDSVAIVPLNDIGQHALWVRYLEGALPKFHRVYSNNPLTRTLFGEAGYSVEGTPLFDRERWVGVGIRAGLAHDQPMDGLLPSAVVRFLREIGGAQRLTMLSTREPTKGG